MSALVPKRPYRDLPFSAFLDVISKKKINIHIQPITSLFLNFGKRKPIQSMSGK